MLQRDNLKGEKELFGSRAGGVAREGKFER